METSGNTDLFGRHRIGFLAGSKISALSVLPTLDWASEVAMRGDASVISGFHSQLERQVLDFLLQGKCGIICALARSLYANVPTEYKVAFAQGRVLFVTEERLPRSSKESAFRRNQIVVALADELVVPKFSVESSLSALLPSHGKSILLL